MYPILNNYVIRGTKEIPRLVSIKRASGVFPLSSLDLVDLVSQFNGVKTIDEIATENNVNPETLFLFIEKLISADIVLLQRSPNRKDVDVSLGPKEPWLSEVHLDITDKCNLAKHCSHCYRGDKLNRGLEKSATEWIEVLDSMVELGVHKVAISGGEAFLKKDLLIILEYIVKKNILVSGIFTNGTLKNNTVKDSINFIKREGINTSFYVSLDGPSPHLNDKNRGQGSFCKTLDFIKFLVDSGLKVTVNSQVNSENATTLIEWYELLQSLGIHRWRMNAGRVYGRLQNNKHLLLEDHLLAEKYAELIKKYIADWRNNDANMKINIESIFRSDMLEKSKAHIFNKSLPICDYKTNACSIEPTGDVQFCTSWGHKIFGNVFSSNLSDIWYGDELQTLKSMQISEISACAGCDVLHLCGGGCRLLASEIHEKDFVACGRYHAFHKHIIPIMDNEGINFIV